MKILFRHPAYEAEDKPVTLALASAQEFAARDVPRDGVWIVEVDADAGLAEPYRDVRRIMRERARTAVKGLSQLAARGSTVLRGDGARDYLPVGEIEPGMKLLIAAGERIPVDGKIIQGSSDLDCSLVSGESTPRNVAPGVPVQAGVLNLTGSLTIETTAAAKDSFLAEMVRLMEAAEGGRSPYRRIADRVSVLYAPVVHLTALITFIGWMVAVGDWHLAMTIAIAVLIITCPWPRIRVIRFQRP